MVSKMLKILRCAWLEYRLWLTDTRMIIVTVLLIFNYILAIKPLIERSEMMKEPVNILEPFVAVGSSGMILLILPIIFMILVSNYPRSHGNTLFQIYRTGRKRWLFSQMIVLAMMIVTYITVIAIGTIIPVIGHCFVGKEWSKVVTDYAEMFPESAGSYDLLPENLYYQIGTVIEAVLHTYGLLSLYLYSIGMIFLCSSLLSLRKSGNTITSFIIAGGAALCSIKSQAMWLLPMAHSITWLHFTKFRREPVFPLWGSYLIFGILCIALTAVAVCAVRNFRYGSYSEN